MRIRSLTTAIISVTLVATGFTVSAANAAAETPQSLGACITSPTRLHENQAIEDNGYRLVMQSDGNLVEYSSTNRPLWNSGTAGHPNAWAVQQGDGNLVVYDANGSVLWASYPALAPGSYRLCIQSDANVVTYNSSGRAVWATDSLSAPTGALRSDNPFPVAAGQCTYWADRMAHNYIHAYPAFSGDAGTWDTYAASQGWHVDHTPRAGSVVVFEPYTHGAGGYGHVAFVLDVYPSTDAIRVSEMDFPHAGVVDTRLVTGVFHTTDVEFIALNP